MASFDYFRSIGNQSLRREECLVQIPYYDPKHIFTAKDDSNL